jgi:hypothetical protein
MRPVAIDQSAGRHEPSVGTLAIQEKYNSDIPAMRCVYIGALKVECKNATT